MIYDNQSEKILRGIALILLKDASVKGWRNQKERKENPIDVHRPLCYDVLVLYLVDLEECYDQSCYEGSGQEGIEVVSEVLKVEKKFCKGFPYMMKKGRLNLRTSEVQDTSNQG